MGNVFIIGNGFDLDFGLPTKYSDYADSKYWPKAAPRTKVTLEEMKREMEQGLFLSIPIIPKLEHTIEDAKDKHTWFDLEQELLVYAKEYDQTNSNYTRFSNETQSEVISNVNYYNKLCSTLNDYISEVQENQDIKTKCIASDVLKSVVGNGFFENIYSFNYTNLNSIAKQIGVSKDIKYVHLHGSVLDNSIILGVDETKLRNGYEIFHKSSSRYYHSHDLYNSLAIAREIVIFGLSFGSIDYSYFDRFFKQLSEGESVTDDRKQYITIFTKDDHSRLSIISNLRNMGINIQRLYAQSHFQIICTSDDVEKKELSDFYKRLEDEHLDYML